MEARDTRWLSVADVADHLGVARDTVYRWIDTKGMPAHRVGRFWKFQLPEVDAWVKSGDSDTSNGSGTSGRSSVSTGESTKMGR